MSCRVGVSVAAVIRRQNARSIDVLRASQPERSERRLAGRARDRLG
jgi:hypothetical protein